MTHHYDIDMRKHGGNNGFKKINEETGKEDIRKLEIPTSDNIGFAKAHQKFLDNKAKRGKKK